jgi:acyl-CoA synthetase (AMP-forming)/AMP-acid ligase II
MFPTKDFTATASPMTPVRFVSVPAMIDAQARRRPKAPALVCGDVRWTHGRLQAATARWRAALAAQGLREGDVAAVCATTSAEYVALFLAAVGAGIVVAPLAPSVQPEALAAMVESAGAGAVFADRSTAVLLRNAGLADLLVPLEAGPPDTRDDTRDDDRSDAASAAAGAGTAASGLAAIEPHWAFNIIFSSGTTGVPKGILQTHERRAAQAARRESLGYGEDAVTLLATPLYSNTTLVALFPTLAAGGTVVLMPKFDALAYLQLAERERATHTMLVPIQYQRILAHPGFGGADLSAFQIKLCAGAPFAPQLKREVLDRWPGGLVEFYGTTEGGGSCHLEAHLWPDKLHTVGRPSPGSEFVVLGDDDQPLAAGQAGEIAGRSPVMMSHYHRQAAPLPGHEWHDAQGRRFLRSGDVGYFDADGFLVLVDRKKDMIISGGFNVYPSDLEAQLRRHPDVEDAAVVGVPSERWGETPMGFVVARAGRPVDADALREWCNGRLGKTQRLAGLQIVAELPRNPLGKVLKRELRDAWLARCGTAHPAGVATSA